MLDPGSVVRESEFAQVAATGSLGQRFQAGALRILAGQRLTAEQRADFTGQARGLMFAQRRTQLRIEQQFRSIAERSGLPPDDVVVDFVGELRDASAGLATPAAGAPAGTPAPTIVIEYDLSGNRITK